jgi:hypothetical protein
VLCWRRSRLREINSRTVMLSIELESLCEKEFTYASLGRIKTLHSIRSRKLNDIAKYGRGDRAWDRNISTRRES